ncbi:MAG: glycosyltransferase family 4 protein [Gemmataceae bacterium]
MKILLLTSSYAPVLGGLQTVTRALARNLLARGHEVRVVTNRYPRRLAGSEIVDGVSVRRWQFSRPSWRQLRQGRLDLFLAALYYCPRVQSRLRRLLVTFRPDVVNVHFPDNQIPFVLGLKRRFGFRLVVSLHGHEVERFTAHGEHNLDSRGLRALLREADAVTACSRYLLESASRLESSLHAKGAVIYNGIDSERFQDATLYQHPRPYLFAMGRLTRKKGFDLLLQALARIDVPAQGLDLIIAGEGEELSTLKEQAQGLGLERRVHFHGRASQEEVIRLLNGCRFLVVPSRVEPFGIVALEGLAAGKGVVATRVGGMAEFLDRETSPPRWRKCGKSGFARPAVVLVAPTVEELAEGLREQLSRPLPVQESDELRAYVRDEYSWRRVTQRYERILGG